MGAIGGLLGPDLELDGWCEAPYDLEPVPVEPAAWVTGRKHPYTRIDLTSVASGEEPEHRRSGFVGGYERAAEQAAFASRYVYFQPADGDRDPGGVKGATPPSYGNGHRNKGL